jgi:hypothetical protein
MNIETLQDDIHLFKQEVIDSGFKRDIDDFVGSLPASQNNILALRDMANKTLVAINKIYSRDLPEALRVLLPTEKIPPFTKAPHNETLKALVGNTEMPQATFFGNLSNFLNQLQQQLNQNIAEIKRIEQFIAPYVSQELGSLAVADFAVVSIGFKEKATISNLKRFSSTLALWSRTLPIYHQLLKSKPPKEIEIVAIQNGSIDLVVHVNVDIAVKLAEIFEVGFKAFAAYLIYKKGAKPIVDAYFGNKKLLDLENEKEKCLLENVKEAVQREIELQHAAAKVDDKSVDNTAIAKKVEQVASLVVAHIVKGNDIKLLALPAPSATEKSVIEGGGSGPVEIKNTLLESSIQARREFQDMRPDDQQKLLEMYGEPESSRPFPQRWAVVKLSS